jgi:hypothetical protein
MNDCITCKSSARMHDSEGEGSQTLKWRKNLKGRTLKGESIASRNDILYLAGRTGTSARDGFIARDKASLKHC